MAEKLGQFYKLSIGDGASPEVFTEVAGQTGLSRDGSTTLIDQSSKTTGKYALQTPGRANLTFTCTGVVTIPDTLGLEAVIAKDAEAEQTAVGFQVKDTSVSPDHTAFEAQMYVSNFSMDFPDQDNATYSFQVTLQATPTVDDLSP